MGWSVCVCVCLEFLCVPPSPLPGIPAAIKLAGFVPGILLLVLVAVVTNYTVLLLIKNGIISNKFSYQVRCLVT